MHYISRVLSPPPFLFCVCPGISDSFGSSLVSCQNFWIGNIYMMGKVILICHQILYFCSMLDIYQPLLH
ncbi:hypothetical protein FKM82_011682 [Ascaphus truei]